MTFVDGKANEGVSVLLHSSCVILGKLLNYSVPQLLHLRSGKNESVSHSPVMRIKGGNA